MMNSRIRSYILPGLILLLLCFSCSRDDEPLSERVPISFTCSSGSVDVRADASFAGSSILVTNQHFAVFGWDKGSGFLSDDPGPGTPNFWNGSTPVDVTFRNNDDRGKNNYYDPTDLPDIMDQYWPRSTTPAYCYSFWSYYPYAAGGSNGIALRSFASNPDGTVGIFDFTTQTTPGAMIDFCVSDVANDVVYGNTNSPYPGTVALTFHHALTRVQFKFVMTTDASLSGTTIKLLDAKLKNIYKTGTLTTTYTPHATPGLNHPGTTAFAWSNQATPVEFEITVGGVNPETSVPSSHVSLLPPMDTPAPSRQDIFLMIPQYMLTSGAVEHQDLYIKWSVDDGGGATTYDTTVLLDECKTEVGGSVDSDIDWFPNQFVTYTIVIGAKPIEFNITTSIAPWDREVNGYYPIVA